MTLGRDEALMVTLKCCCFRCDLLRCASRTGQIQIVEGPFFELRLHNVWLVTPCTYEYLCIHITWSPRSKIKENPCTFPDGTQVQYMGLIGPLVCPVRRTIVRTSLNWAYFFSPIPVKPEEGQYICFPSVSQQVYPSFRHSVCQTICYSVQSVSLTFLCSPWRYWLEMWYEFAFHGETEELWLLSRLN